MSKTTANFTNSAPPVRLLPASRARRGLSFSRVVEMPDATDHAPPSQPRQVRSAAASPISIRAGELVAAVEAHGEKLDALEAYKLATFEGRCWVRAVEAKASAECLSFDMAALRLEAEDRDFRRCWLWWRADAQRFGLQAQVTSASPALRRS